ncbi:uncharacterized protein VTP21DRAFT_4929 [Calcarisporiella thermophila]|uniref:uncharacterized protein n=1 Tax=Calcarisporiella thermophila TaxID=911321 RepID=UPI003742AD51
MAFRAFFQPSVLGGQAIKAKETASRPPPFLASSLIIYPLAYPEAYTLFLIYPIDPIDPHLTYAHSHTLMKLLTFCFLVPVVLAVPVAYPEYEVPEAAERPAPHFLGTKLQVHPKVNLLGNNPLVVIRPAPPPKPVHKHRPVEHESMGKEEYEEEGEEEGGEEEEKLDEDTLLALKKNKSRQATVRMGY